jgi:MFS family permease
VNRALGFVFAVVFIDLLGTGILIPVIPFLVRQFTPLALPVGLLALTFSAAQFLASPLLGALSDRHGRRPVLVLSVFGTGCAYLTFGLAGSLWVMFAARILDGVTGGNISAAQAYIADVTPAEDRAKNFALIGVAFGMGFMLGPAIGGLLSRISLQAPAFAAAGLAFLNAGFGALFLPESLAQDKRRKQPLRLGELNPLRAIATAAGGAGVQPLLLSLFAMGLAMATLRSNFAVFTAARFGLGASENGWFFAFIGLVTILVQGVLIRRIKRVAPRSLVIAGLLVMAAGFTSVPMTPVPRALFVSVGLIALGSGFASPNLTALLSATGGTSDQGLLLGAASSRSVRANSPMPRRYLSHDSVLPTAIALASMPPGKTGGT